MTTSAVVHKMELRDLESVLRKKLGESFVVTRYKTEPLIPAGENYCSTLLKVEALVKETADAEEKELNLVAKMMPPTDYQRQLFDSENMCRKEVFFYEELLPAYRQLEREFGLDYVFDNAPRFYGARFSKEDDDGKFDDDAVILMENLKILGYYTVDRLKGMDEEHIKKSIVVMARFHALGMAMKRHRPKFFEIIKSHSKCPHFEIDEDEIEEMNAFLEMMREDSITAPYYEDIKNSMTLDMHEVWQGTPTEPWSTIIHMDLWINNIMFLKDTDSDSGKAIVDVKFIDFQGYLFMSPLRDLVFFLMMNPSVEVMEKIFDELLDLYYDTFVGCLNKMKCDVSPYARDKFNEQLKIDAIWEFSHCPFMTKVMTTQFNHDNEIDEIECILKKPIISPLFVERIRLYVTKYAEKGWFSKKS